MKYGAIFILVGIAISIIIFFFIFKSELNIIEAKFSWWTTTTLGFSFIVINVVLYTIYVNTIEWDQIKTLIISVYTAINFSALYLSWHFFNQSHCWEYEANIIAQKEYFKYGEDLPHLKLFGVRLLLNIFLGYLLLANLVLIDSFVEMYNGMKLYTTILLYCINTSIFTVELFANIWANMNPPQDPCKHISEYCKKYGGEWCDTPNMIEKGFL